jgi:hypothetical protein
MLDFAEQTGSGIVIMVWSFLNNKTTSKYNTTHVPGTPLRSTEYQVLCYLVPGTWYQGTGISFLLVHIIVSSTMTQLPALPVLHVLSSFYSFHLEHRLMNPCANEGPQERSFAARFGESVALHVE